MCFCLFDLILYVTSTIFQLNREGSSWVEPVLSLDICVLLKDHNTETLVRLEPVAPFVSSQALYHLATELPLDANVTATLRLCPKFCVF